MAHKYAHTRRREVKVPCEHGEGDRGWGVHVTRNYMRVRGAQYPHKAYIHNSPVAMPSTRRKVVGDAASVSNTYRWPSPGQVMATTFENPAALASPSITVLAPEPERAVPDPAVNKSRETQGSNV